MFMKRKKILSWSLAMAISLLLCGGGIGYAKVTGVCSNCHTMHSSQDGAALSGPNELLLIGGCVGCHTGENTAGGITPYVMATTQPSFGVGTTGCLAGGNFYWVAQPGGDVYGHNVMGIAGQDSNISISEGAPGRNAFGCNISPNCHVTLAVAQTAKPDLGSGCQGCHLNVMHHTDDSTGTKYVGASPWYRFLSGHNVGQGVVGIEDNDWQYTRSSSDHNEYLGYVGSKTSMGGFTNAGNTTTAFCTGCHGNFHVQDGTTTGASPWLRHPSDSVIPNSGEYASMSIVYNPDLPVARDADTMTALGNVPGTETTAGDMVMCLSCHVAHGSPYPDMLRWDYTKMNAGDGGDWSGLGCFACHTSKD